MLINEQKYIYITILNGNQKKEPVDENQIPD